MVNRIQYEDDNEWEEEPESNKKKSLRDHRGGFSRNAVDEEDDTEDSEDAS